MLSKAAVTFTEIFIVLALVFLIQTVANFNLFEGIAEEEQPADFVVLSIRQVPSSGNDTDHVRYLRFRSGSFVRSLNFGSSLVDAHDVRWRVDNLGNCVGLPPTDPAQSSNWNDEAARLAFSEILRKETGISVSRVEVSGVQPEYILSWSPRNLPSGTDLAIGVQHCFIPSSDPNALAIDPNWRLRTDALEFPHPVIVTRTRYRERIDREPQRVEYVHSESLPLGPLRTLSGPRYQGLAFGPLTSNCDAGDRTRDKIRQIAVKEIQLSLSEA